ncbi:hypothetical protein VOLCADRAFT_86860 [Volvox carteri f. nagariensis]|uniref:Uncharacterized protein n=1 Tax=Volvox carteri f. nagariensis TaxID=3068 RepID=D8TJT3_VOLCA|nr:uncharacterized protein VOLCADRAFT_86860 [Volvox carteri f. nagariensis]EFJ52599.1 hypothetical protein VOLCADRAFT_86860 [Volvox carteri f. nagariensis]|eukprot:XP_002946672.1 hypothetical protein VOLCADRAFT_86860 [Volvox carteri f. nagariensis]
MGDGFQRVVRRHADVAVQDTSHSLYSSELIVLLDPKNERLVYLLSVDNASSADDVAVQMRGLLQAAAAPYVHLMALPAGLRRSLLRQLVGLARRESSYVYTAHCVFRSITRGQFPGGQPVITQVPLPTDLATALQHQHQQLGKQQQGKVPLEGVSSSSAAGAVEPHQEEGPQRIPQDDGGGLSGETEERESPSGSRTWAPGGVLELLYGSSELQPGGLVAEGAAAHASASAGRKEPEAEVLDGGRDLCERDLPDGVLSRRKAVGRLMAWHKGASMRVACRRNERTKYKFDWLIQGLNSIDQLSVAVMTPNIILLRNNVEANLGVDDLYNILDGESDDDDDDNDDDDGGEGGGKVKVIKLQVDGSEGLAQGLAEVLKHVQRCTDRAAFLDVLCGMSTHRTAMFLLVALTPHPYAPAIGAQGDAVSDTEQSGDSDDEDEDEDEDEGANVIEVEDFAELLSMLANDNDSDNDEEVDVDDGDGNDAEASSSSSDDKGREDESPSDNLLARSLLRNGQFREVMPGVFVQVLDGGVRRVPADGDDGDEVGYSGSGGGGREGGVEEDDGDGQHEWDMSTTLDVQLSPGPMGWTAMVRVGVGADKDKDGRTDGGDAAAGSRRRDALREALRADAEHLQNIRRLEALWDKQVGEDSPQEQQPHQGQGQQQQEEEAVSEPGSAAASPAPAARPQGTSGNQDGSGVSGADGLNSRGGLEADWRQAERRAAARGGSPGRGFVDFPPGGGVGAAAALGAVPTDRLMGPPRRTGTAGAGAAASGAVGGTANGDEPCGEASVAGRVVRDEGGAPDSPSTTGDSTADGLISSTRSRRGATAEGLQRGKGDTGPAATHQAVPGEGEEGSDAGTDGLVARPRPVGRSRMVRRPRGRVRMGRQSPDPPPASNAAETGTAASLPASTSSPSAPGKEAGGPHDPAATTGASGNNSTSAGDAVSIPAYRHMKQVPGSGGVAAGTDVGVGATGAPSNGSRQTWGGRTGPGAPAPQGAGGSGGGSGLPPEAAGYAALDLEQLAHFVLGRQASPEEVQDLARAVAQSAEVEEALGNTSTSTSGGYQPHSFHQQQQQQQQQPPGTQQKHHGAQGLGGDRSGKHHRRRPGTRLQSSREASLSAGRNRRSVVTPRHRRLTIPEPVLRLADFMQAAQVQRQSSVMDGGEELAAAVLAAFRTAPLLERQAAEALVDFLRGRWQPGHQRDWRRGHSGYHGNQERPGVAEVLRHAAGLPGLVRGRDAVVVLPRTLLEATVGAWQEQEQRVMHEDYRTVGRQEW